jgi:hypothetical protein
MNAEEKIQHVADHTLPKLVMLSQLLQGCAKKTEEAGDALMAMTLEGAATVAGEASASLLDILNGKEATMGDANV